VYDLASLTIDSNPGDMAVDATVSIETGSLGFGEGQILQWSDTMAWTGGGMLSGNGVKSSDGAAWLRIQDARHFQSAGDFGLRRRGDLPVLACASGSGNP
jgi:hypothetical protein